MNSLLITELSTKTYPPDKKALLPSKEHEVLQVSTTSLKASVFRTFKNHQMMVVKDFSNSHLLLRLTLCQLFQYREIKAMKRLNGMEGVPKYLGRFGRNGFAMEGIDGQQVNTAMLKNNAQLIEQLEQRVQSLHLRGVAHNDLHLRNFLVDSNENIFLIDFGGAIFQPKKSFSIGNIFFNLACLGDCAKIARLKKKICPEQLSDHDEQLIQRSRLLRKLTKLWKKFFHRKSAVNLL